VTAAAPAPVDRPAADAARSGEAGPFENVATTPAEPAEAHDRAPGAAGHATSWRALAARGANAAAYAQLGHDGVATVARSASVDDLFALADVARLSGHAAEAVDPLQRIMANEREPRASLAALTLGRVQLRSLAQPKLAARALARALALGLPADLAEAASALLVEALARSGDPDAARKAYAELVERFPRSERIGELQQWLRDP
jgi:transmembrane sensor